MKKEKKKRIKVGGGKYMALALRRHFIYKDKKKESNKYFCRKKQIVY